MFTPEHFAEAIVTLRATCANANTGWIARCVKEIGACIEMVDGMMGLNLCAAQFQRHSGKFLRFWNPPEGSLEDALRALQDEWPIDLEFITIKCDRDLLQMGIKTQLTPLQRRKHVTWAEMRTITRAMAQYRINHPIPYTGVAYSRVCGDGIRINRQIWGSIHPKHIASHRFDAVLRTLNTKPQVCIAAESFNRHLCEGEPENNIA